MENTLPNLKCKILVIGDKNTGKNAVIHKYVDPFDADDSPTAPETIGVDFHTKEIDWDGQYHITLQIWDTAGQERFHSMTTPYYRNANAAFVVFDVDDNNTFDSVKFWKTDIDKYCTIGDTNDRIPVILLANRMDPTKYNNNKSQKSPDELTMFCKEHGFITWFQVCVNSGNSKFINSAFERLVAEIMENENNIASCSENKMVIDETQLNTINSNLSPGCCSS